MGLQAKIKAKRVADRRAKAALDKALDEFGVTERVRAAYLALQRADVQDRIREKATGDHAPWSEQIPLANVAASALREFVYDLGGVTVTAYYRDGVPPIVYFKADASAEAIVAAGFLPPEEPRAN